MIKYIALLRGISPTNPQMKNEKLRGVFESLGFVNVTSLISSGNIVFTTNRTDTQQLETEIETAIQAKLGFFSPTIIRDARQIRALIKKDYFKGLQHSENSYLTVTFLKHLPPKQDVPLGSGYTITGIDGREIFSVVDASGKSSNLMSRLERQFGSEITTRTWMTVQRIDKALSS